MNNQQILKPLNSQIALKIRQICKDKDTSVSKVLNDCSIRKSLIYDLERRDYLDCSVDYLIGRTDNPNSHKS